ncbi:MAG TPA: TSUP family transporter, partial [Magnetococcales bacterium]|nr:TSUP family transporter [Magnetococcales bacterium]
MVDGSYAVAGALTGFVVGLTGVGGGALMTPILLLFFGVAPVTAIATDLWFAVVTKFVAAGIHGTGGRVDWQVVRRLWGGSLPVALLVVMLVGYGVKIHKIQWMSQAIGVVVLLTAMGLLFAPAL